MFVQFTRDYVSGSGRLFQGGDVFDLEKVWATQLISDGAATLWTSGDPKAAQLVTDPLTGMATGLTGPNGSAFFGPVTSEVWMKVPSIFRLRFTGTGTAVMDSRDSLGNIAAALYSYTLAAATDQIEFPYAGDDAVNIRVTLTGTVTCEVI